MKKLPCMEPNPKVSPPLPVFYSNSPPQTIEKYSQKLVEEEFTLLKEEKPHEEEKKKKMYTKFTQYEPLKDKKLIDIDQSLFFFSDVRNKMDRRRRPLIKRRDKVIRKTMV